MGWKPAGNIAHRTQLIKDEYPGITVYQVGDTSHQASASDHNPDSREIVHAFDAMTYSDTQRGNEICDWCLRDTTDAEYIIFNRKIYERDNDFKARDYTGSDPHADHVHWSGKHGNTGYAPQTGTGYDTDAEKYQCAGFHVEPAKRYGGGMFLFTVEGDLNVWKCDGGKRSVFSGPDTGGVYTYHAYTPLETAGVPMARYAKADIDAMGLSVVEALDYIGGPLA
jgi:hypothetical protein